MTELMIINPEPDAIDRAVAVIQTAHEKAAEIPANVIRAGAILALQVGANPNPLARELWIYPIKGKYTPYLGIAYYRRIAEERGARVMFAPPVTVDGYHNLSNEPRAMTPEERTLYRVPDKVDASICRGYRGDRLLELLEHGVPWPDAVAMLCRTGVAYLHDEEKRDRNGAYMNPPNGRSWQWKCDKRAEVDLYNRLGVVAQLVHAAASRAELISIEEPAETVRYTVEDANRDLF